MAGTRWVQKNLLDAYPTADLAVYAVWFDMYPGDARSKWPSDLLTDPRVVHRWDDTKAAGRYFGARSDAMRSRLTPGSSWNGPILWDSFLLYARDATWAEAPTGLIHWGRTIVAGRVTLQEDFQRLFGQWNRMSDAPPPAPPRTDGLRSSVSTRPWPWPRPPSRQSRSWRPESGPDR